MALAQTAVSICNLALRHLAVTTPIASLTGTTEEAKACAAFYEQVKEEVLRDFPWPFAWRYAPLTRVDGTEAIATTQDFQYAYRLPDDAVRVHRILGADRAADDGTRIPFSLGSDASGGLIYTDVAPLDATTSTLQQPQLEYTAIASEVDFPADFAQCLALKLAFYMAPSLTKGDPFKLGDRALAFYDRMKTESQGAAAREQQFDPPPESEFITARL